jgi:serine/threonine protein kinase
MALRTDALSEPIPGYRLIERIGRGGFGEVWKAEAPGGLLKAIKFVIGELDQSPDGPAPAEQELKALSRVKSVRHPYILSLDRYEVIDGQLVVVMELADRNLWDRYRECRTQGLPGVPRPELLRYMEETAEALDLMNIEHQLQHLDIKPQNLFLVFNHVKVADFGLVKALEGIGASVSWGVTPAYAAPETFEGVVSRYCDQYSLAIVYQELLTGQRPFNGANARQLLLQHTQKPPDLTLLDPAERGPISRALAKRPDDRFASCSDLVRALREAVAPPATPVAGEPATPITPAVAQLSPRWAPAPANGSAEATHTPRTAAPEELHGEGVLFPAVVIAAGGAALEVMKVLRKDLQQRFGALEALPQLQMLYVDTDPDGSVSAVAGDRGTSLLSRELLLARLHRPSHYLKSNESRTLLESWLDTHTLYRMPRVPETTGVRSLGRLAYVSNRREIAERLAGALEACAKIGALDAASRSTGLGLRMSRPHVYVVSSLAGGTGSGMLIDLAYAARTQLMRLGYEHPNVIGVLLAPPADGAGVKAMALGNTLAALLELNHFHSFGFSARYHPKEEKLRCNGPPLSRYVILPMRRKSASETTDGASAADFLLRELVTPLGRLGAAESAEQPTTPQLTFETTGVSRLVWPREAIVRTAARRLSRQLLERWADKNREPVSQSVAEWLAGQWDPRELGPEGLIARFQETCRAALGRAPEDALDEAVAAPPGSAGVEPAAAPAALKRLEELVGRPGDAVAGQRASRVQEALIADAGFVTAEWEKKLSQLMVDLVDHPAFRLAGSEEAIHQTGAKLNELGQTYENLCQEMAASAAECREAILALLQPATRTPARTKAATKLAELLRSYGRSRYQSLVLQRVCMVFQSLRGNIPEVLQEIGFLRTRMSELTRSLRKDRRSLPDVSIGKLLLPKGCPGLDEAVESIRLNISPEEQEALQDRVQEIVKSRFKGLMPVLNDARHRGPEFVEALREEVERFVEERLQGSDAIGVLLANHPDEAELLQKLAAMYEEAAPELTGTVDEATLKLALALVPSGAATERFQAIAAKVWPDVHWALSDRLDEIVLYRKVGGLALSSLPQVGPLAQDAYQQMSSSQHLTPHSRSDVGEWLPLTREPEATEAPAPG